MALWRAELPGIQPHYAVKANSDPLLLKTLCDLGAGFDCASLREVLEVQTMKAAPVVYAHPLKSDRDIHTIRGRIQTTVVDSIEECHKLARHEWPGDALVRVAVNDADSLMPFSSKFGATLAEVGEIARKSRIPLSGISFHVGSGCQRATQYSEALKVAQEGLRILRACGHSARVVDIGGGFSADPERFREAAKVLRESLFSPQVVTCPSVVIAEPGRFFAAPFQDLFVKVIARKAGGPNGLLRYVIDESIYGQFSCIPFDYQKPAFVRIPAAGNPESRPVRPGVLFGRTCDSLDVIAKGPMEELDVGDWLYFPHMGAYTSSTASEFNGFPKPLVFTGLSDLLPLDVTTVVTANPALTYSNTVPAMV